MKKIIILKCISVFLILVSCNELKTESDAILLLNHTGYHTTSLKKVVLQTSSTAVPKEFQIHDQTNKVVFTGQFEKGGKVDQWHTNNAYSGNFNEFDKEGAYYITTQISGFNIKSRTFNINSETLVEKSLELLVEGFESQHAIGVYEDKDREMVFFGERKDTIDLHGGWYDASGDKSKYFSHLCFSNYMPPQQTPIFVWNLLESIEQYQQKKNTDDSLIDRMQRETNYGADFLMRMQDQAGYFYLTIFDNWSGDPDKREICAYEGIEGIKNNKYKAGFREGAGIAIAALARASRSISKGEYSNQNYLAAAIKGFEHLLKYNYEYIDNGKENIIDDYCVLLAAMELYIATKESLYLEYARKRMQQLTDRLSKDDNYSGWWRADDTGNRPYFHAAEAGLPLIALHRFLQFEKEEKYRDTAINAIQKSFDFEVAITKEVNNPFGYPRQYIKATDENEKRASFFIPHQNETGYWWQGENSRLASYASAFYMIQPYLTKEQRVVALQFANNNINWILGLNPYDMSMVDGLGFNNPYYDEEGVNVNFKGGVANGITAGYIDETDITYMPKAYKEDPANKWRWAEQWMPHGSWFMLAITSSKE